MEESSFPEQIKYTTVSESRKNCPNCGASIKKDVYGDWPKYTIAQATGDYEYECDLRVKYYGYQDHEMYVPSKCTAGASNGGSSYQLNDKCKNSSFDFDIDIYQKYNFDISQAPKDGTVFSGLVTSVLYYDKSNEFYKKIYDKVFWGIPKNYVLGSKDETPCWLYTTEKPFIDGTTIKLHFKIDQFKESLIGFLI
jgi:hypothetical protein